MACEVGQQSIKVEQSEKSVGFPLDIKLTYSRGKSLYDHFQENPIDSIEDYPALTNTAKLIYGWHPHIATTRLNFKLHSIDGYPAIILPDNRQFWFSDGVQYYNSIMQHLIFCASHSYKFEVYRRGIPIKKYMQLMKQAGLC